jgi:xylitol oxidase
MHGFPRRSLFASLAAGVSWMSCDKPGEKAVAPALPPGGDNWARTFTYSAERFVEPALVEELQQVAQASNKLKPLGSRHSFSRVADTTGTLVSLRRFNQAGAADPARRTVTVGGGVRYGELVTALDQQGFALHNLASLPHISVAGAIATGTHGSGSRNGNLSTAVQALELVTSSGALHTVSREKDGPAFDGMVVSLGSLGLVTKVTLKVEPRYEMRQWVFEKLPLASLEKNFDAIMDAAYSVSLFTTWSPAGIEEVWVKERTDGKGGRLSGKSFFGASPASENLHPIKGISPEPCTPQLGVPGPWYERLPHFRMGFTPSSGEEIQTEYFVPRKQALPALLALFGLHKQLAPVLQISEVRAIAGDQLWLSPAYGRDSIALHFTWKKDEAGVLAVLPLIEEALRPFEPRPHWGKISGLGGAEIGGRYPQLLAFRALRDQWDAPGKLRNRFLEANIAGR